MNSTVSDAASSGDLRSERSQERTAAANPGGFAASPWRYFWLLALLPSLVFVIPYLRTLWRQELYQYFPFVFLGVGFLFHTRWDRVLRGPRTRISWGCIVLGVLLLALAAFMHSTWVGNLGFVLLATAFLLSQRSAGGAGLGYLALPLIMLIRMPQLHAQSFVSRLRKITTQLGGLGLDVSGVPNDTYSNVIHLPNKDLFVAEACSGIQSAFTMVFLALLLIVWKRRPLITIPIYVLASLLFAVVGNTFRVMVIAMVHWWYGLDWSVGWQHDLIGYVSLAISAGFLLSFDVLASLVLHPVITLEDARGVNPFAAVWNWLVGDRRGDYEQPGYPSAPSRAAQSSGSRTRQTAARGPSATGYGVMGVAALAGVIMMIGYVSGRSDTRPIMSKEALLFDPPEGFLDDRLGVLLIGDHQVVRNGADPQLGLHADVWNCGTNNNIGRIAMSQPFVGWHELCVCYEVQDWKLEDRYNMSVDAGKPIAVGEFTQEEGTHGYLLFTAIDTDGSVPTPPSYTLFGRLLAPFIPLATDDFAETSGSAQTIMLQLWTVSSEALEPSEIRQLAEAVAEVRERARAGIVSGQTGGVADNAQASLKPRVMPR